MVFGTCCLLILSLSLFFAFLLPEAVFTATALALRQCWVLATSSHRIDVANATISPRLLAQISALQAQQRGRRLLLAIHFAKHMPTLLPDRSWPRMTA